MENRVVVSPFFLGEPLPPLERFAAGARRLNQPRPEGGDPRTRMTAVHRPLARLVEQAVRDGTRPVSLAGDCCTTLGVLAGLQAAGLHPTLVWLDAHGDFNTPETTPSGFIGGMPLAMIVGRGEQDLARDVGLAAQPEADVFLADARDLDPLEAAALRGSAVHHVPRLADLPPRLPPTSPLYVHLDCDVLSPDDAPAMRYPAAGGPRLAEARAVMEALAATGRVAAVSMTVWDFGRDRDGRSEQACTRLLESLLGEW